MGTPPFNPGSGDGSQGPTAQGGGYVWMPHGDSVPRVTEYAPGYRIITGNKSVMGQWSVDRATNYFFGMSPREQARAKRLTERFTGGTADPSTIQWAWGNAVRAAAAANAANPKARVTPWDMMRKWQGDGPGGSGPGGGGSGGPTTTTSTSVNRQVQRLNRGQARSMLKQILEQEVGRSFGRGEVDKFIKMFNEQSAAHPSVTKSTTTTTTSGSSQSSSSSSVSSGGVDAQDIATRYAQSRPDWAEYQTAVPLMDAFMQAIQSPAGAE